MRRWRRRSARDEIRQEIQENHHVYDRRENIYHRPVRNRVVSARYVLATQFQHRIKGFPDLLKMILHPKLPY